MTRALSLVEPVEGSEPNGPADPVFRLSTPGEATDGNIVKPFWNLERAESVGIPLLWGHDQSTLLGRMHGMRLEGSDLIGTARFDVASADGAERLRQVRDGFLSAVSIGWIPGEMVRRSDLPRAHPDWREAREDECGFPAEGSVMGSARSPNTLLEVSLVPVPADPRASVLSRALQASGADDITILFRSMLAQPKAAESIDRFMIRRLESTIRQIVDVAVNAALEAHQPRARRLAFRDGQFTTEK